jgi:hypothetical protein
VLLAVMQSSLGSLLSYVEQQAFDHRPRLTLIRSPRPGDGDGNSRGLVRGHGSGDDGDNDGLGHDHARNSPHPAAQAPCYRPHTRHALHIGCRQESWRKEDSAEKGSLRQLLVRGEI